MRKFVFQLAALATALAPIAAAAQAAPELSLEQRLLLRCSAAFALVAAAQEKGEPGALRYPSLEIRGREFFVRSAAEVMDAAGLDRAAIDAALTREARDLVASETLEEIMPVCLRALADSGL